MDLETIIAVVWVCGLGAAGVITSLLFYSEKYREWSVEKIGTVTFFLSALVVVFILLVVFWCIG